MLSEIYKHQRIQGRIYRFCAVNDCQRLTSGAVPNTLNEVSHIPHSTLEGRSQMQTRNREEHILAMLNEIRNRHAGTINITPHFVRLTTDIFDKEVLNPETALETDNILNMWRILQDTYANFSPEQKEAVKKGTGRPMPEFPGFDEQEDHFYAARYLLEHFNNYPGVKQANSHMPTVHMHRRMLTDLRWAQDSIVSDGLSADQLVEVLQAWY
jgi:uncharacterized protein YfbU (UPF0304 family)